MAEGVRLCRDAAYSGVRILRMFYTEEALERYPKDVELLREKRKELFCFLSSWRAAYLLP